MFWYVLIEECVSEILLTTTVYLGNRVFQSAGGTEAIKNRKMNVIIEILNTQSMKVHINESTQDAYCLGCCIL